jgi:uncharacterized MAPEG superfamily protein
MRAVPQGIVNTLAVTFILIRIVYVLLYLTNRPTPRSIVWSAGLLCNLAIFFAPVWA